MVAGTCLLIGGNGFIGRNITSSLHLAGYRLVVFDLGGSGQLPSNVQYIYGSIENTEQLVAVANKVENVIWLVHTSVPSTSMSNIELDLSSNILPLVRFLQLFSKNTNKKKFIYFSSGGTVYGDTLPQIPLVEEAPKDPISSYGLTKLVAEEYVNFFFKRSAVAAFILRPSNVFGRYQNLEKPQGIIGHAFKSVMFGNPIEVFGDGTVIRDYIHVKDVAAAVILCLSSTVKNDSVPATFNIGSGFGTSINEILELISNVTKQSISVKRMPSREYDCKYNVLDYSKASIHIGWKPKISLIEGLTDFWSWLQEELMKP